MEKNYVISLNGSKAAGKSTLANNLKDAGVGSVYGFYDLRYHFQIEFLPVIQPDAAADFGIRNWKLSSALLCFALDWHRMIKNNNTKCLIFDHYYADYLVQQLSSVKEIDCVLDIIDFFQLPSFTEGYHFFIDASYDNYLIRREQRIKDRRIKDRPKYQRDINIITEKTYHKRRDMYLELVDMGYLIHIDANHSPEHVCQMVREHIGM